MLLKFKFVLKEIKMIMDKDNIIEIVYQELKLTPTELSEELNVTTSAISQWKTRGIPKDKKKIMQLMIELNEKNQLINTIKGFYKSMEKIVKT